MNASPQQARQIFVTALKLAPEQWDAYLQEACGDDETLRERVQNLLAAHMQAGSFLEPAAGAIAPSCDSPLEQAGQIIGGYRLLEQIGEGGFGVVYMAEQTAPVRRKVALKILKPGMDTRQVLARFEAERQALAIMDHPNIAKVFDGGATPTGRPYFVMELVKGVPITEFCDQNQLAPRQRLELFISVCQAVHHAHQKGIIHRDLKPSNVLVSRHDTTPIVKMIDFGVAKALGQELTDKTLFTGIAQMIGTPLYMSPEQAGMSDLDIDTRSDIYSLGVLLYELLTGTTPFTKERFKQVAYEEMRRIIREEDPPKPSTRLSELSGAVAPNDPTSARKDTTLVAISAQRHTEPAQLTQLVRGELDWIVMKCLEKDRNRRYDTASAFAKDVQQYLADEPVQACPPSAWYRFGKFARRHKPAIAVGVGLTLASLLAVGALIISNARISSALTAETKAKEELKEAIARERSNFYSYALGLARRDWLAGEIEQARQNLNACPLELRDRDWRYLHRVCHAELHRFNQKNVGRILYRPDGKVIACAGAGNLAILTLADAETGQTNFTSLATPMSDPSLWFSEDGSELIWAGVARTPFFAINPQAKAQGNRFAVWWWNVQAQKMIRHRDRDCNGPGRVHLSADGQRISLVDLKKVTICDARSGEEIFNLAGLAGDVQLGPIFHPSGRSLATVDGNRVLRFWNAETGQPRHQVPLPCNVRSLAFSPDGRFLVGVTYQSSRGNDALTIWDAQTGDDVATLPGHAGQISLVAFSRDGRRLASAGSDSAIMVWDLDQKRERLTLRGHKGAILGLAFHPDGQRLASSSSDGTMRIWDVTPGEESTALKGAEREK